MILIIKYRFICNLQSKRNDILELQITLAIKKPDAIRIQLAVIQVKV
jgi:hypothetical protein|tara:strand:- start:100 stop:240 length:141 start_codon:yes stop_codon:yes gene_type:complete